MIDLAVAPLTRREIRLAEHGAAQPAASPLTGADCGSSNGAPLSTPRTGPTDVEATSAPTLADVPLADAPPAEVPLSPVPLAPADSAERRLLADLRGDPGHPGRASRGRHGRALTRSLTRRPGRGPVLTASFLVLAATLVTGGVTQVNAARAEQAAFELALERQRHEAFTTGVTREIERRERADDAAVERLTAQGQAYAASKRNEALLVARAAVETAGAVAITVAPVVSPEDLTPLDEALSQLTALIETAPAPEVPSELPAAPREPTPIGVPQHDGHQPTLPVEPLAVPTELEPIPSPTAPVEVAAPQAAAAPMGGALDLAVSAQLVATAGQVAALSEQVQAVAAANIAAAEEAARIAAEEAAAAASAAEKRARLVRIADQADNGHIPRDALCPVAFHRSTLLRCDAADALADLNDAYRAEFGKNLDLSGGYRDFDAQVATKEARGDLAAEPGTSNHGFGLAVDFAGFGGVGQFTLPTYRWMKANGPDFGWYHPPYMEPGGFGPAEPWHWEFGEL